MIFVKNLLRGCSAATGSKRNWKRLWTVGVHHCPEAVARKSGKSDSDFIYFGCFSRLSATLSSLSGLARGGHAHDRDAHSWFHTGHQKYQILPYGPHPKPH